MNSVYVAKSNIDGYGLFAKKYFKMNDVILYNCIDNDTHYISDYAGYVNHSYRPNSTLYYDGRTNHYHLVALDDINILDEIVADYNHTPHFINKPESHWL